MRLSHPTILLHLSTPAVAAAAVAVVAVVMGIPLALKGQCHEIIFTSSHIFLYCKLAAVAAAVAFS